MVYTVEALCQGGRGPQTCWRPGVKILRPEVGVIMLIFRDRCVYWGDREGTTFAVTGAVCIAYAFFLAFCCLKEKAPPRRRHDRFSGRTRYYP